MIFNSAAIMATQRRGELGIFATACHHIVLTLPNVVDGNQQTAHMMTDDIVTETIPITNGPDWGVRRGHGIGVEIVEDKLGKYHELFHKRGQFQPYDPVLIGTELYRRSVKCSTQSCARPASFRPHPHSS